MMDRSTNDNLTLRAQYLAKNINDDLAANIRTMEMIAKLPECG